VPSRGEINSKIGVTDAHLRSQIRSALRRVWRNSSRRTFIESIRKPYVGVGKFKFSVECSKCGRVMGQSEKEKEILNNGKISKRWKSAYEVNHINGNPQFLSMSDLGDYAHSLLYGDVEILCRKCHKEFTKNQT
jgi:hypothetical protein